VIESPATPMSGLNPGVQPPPLRPVAAPAATLIVLALLVAALAAEVGQAWSMRPWMIDSRQAYWSIRNYDDFPVRPPMDARTPDLRTLPTGSTSRIQVSSTFRIPPGNHAPLAVMAPLTEGEGLLFVNGVRTGETAAAVDRFLILPAVRSRLWEIAPDLLRPGQNRIELVLVGATGPGLRAPLLVGPTERLAPTFRAIGDKAARSRLATTLLALVAGGLALGAAAACRSATPWIALSAAALAIGARAVNGGAFLVEVLGDRWVRVDQGLLVMAIVCLGCAALSAGPPLPAVGRRWFARGVAALATLAVLAWFADPRVVPGSGAARGALLLTATGFLVWSGWRWVAAGGGRPVSQRPMASLAIGLAALIAAAALAGDTGQLWGLWQLGLDASYGLGVMVLLVLLGILSGAAGTRAVRRRIRQRADLGQTIRLQQAEIQAASAALEQEMRRSAILEERQRLARDMHDGIGGQLASLLARVRTRRISLDQMESELSGGLSELRLLVDSLDAVGESLAEALATFRSRARTQAEAAGMALVWDQAEDLGIATLDPRWILNLYRLLQETVTNAARHSGGDELSILIERLGERDLSITVEDNGSGYDPETVTRGRGLTNMAIRADQLAARLTFGPGTGGRGARVCIALTVPPARSTTIGQSRGEITPI
jgi:two-component system sensor histidine kinase UhpB